MATQEKIFIQNRDGQKMVVLVENVENQKGLAFIAHGLGGYKEEKHIQMFAEVCVLHGLTTVRFDSTNTLGLHESEGAYEDATVTNYYADLEDVIAWAKMQSWYQEPFMLIGHSLGGISSTLYAQAHPSEVKALAPIATVVSGKLSLEAPRNQNILKEWKESGWRIDESISQPGLIKRLKWSHMEDRLRYDLLTRAHMLNMPMLFMVGELDSNTPPEHQHMLHDAVLSTQKEFHIIKGAGHVFRDAEHLDEAKHILKAWIHSWL